MKTIRTFAWVASVLMTGFSAFAATGDCEENATSISAGETKTVKLVNAWDSEWQEETDEPVHVLKIVCKKGKGYTVTVSGSGVSFYVDVPWSYDDDAPWFDYDAAGTSAMLYESSWSEGEYAGSINYYVYVSGEKIGDSVNVSFKEGAVEPPSPEPEYGTEDNPKPISPATTMTEASGSLLGGAYYFTASLKQGNKYKFYTGEGTEAAPRTIEIYAREKTMEEPELKEIDVGDYNQGYVVKPRSAGSHMIKVSGSEGSAFALNYGMVPARKPAEHDAVDLGAIAAKETKADFQPGHRNDPDSGFSDDVIDETLFKVSLAANAMYRFATEGTATNLVMEVYDAGGSILQTNVGGIGTDDCALTFVPTAKGDYYVGVCEDLADDETDEPTGQTIAFSAKLVTLADGYADACDPEDDAYLGATGLEPCVGMRTSDVVKEGASAGARTLGVGDLEDWFRIDARKGLSYKVGADILDPASKAADHVVLQAKVYTLSGGKLKEFSGVSSTGGDLTKGMSFTADAHTSYYIQVTLKDGAGLDFGPYELKSLAYDAGGGKLGTLRVDIGGATYAEGAKWWLDKETSVTYPGGASVLLAEGKYTVNFAAVKNWSTPAARSVTIAGSAVTPVDVKYSDTSDHGDDVVTGAAKLAPAAKAATVSRSLWTDDPADWFKFTVKASTYYTFALEPSSKLGDAYICVYAGDKKSVVAEGTSAKFLCRDTKGDYYVCVKHVSAPAVDSQYTMTYSAVQVGTVGFAKATASVKDTATSVALTVNRASGKEGTVRVRYSTFAGTAEPGKNYINQSGILEWAANDSKAKTITIGLLGDLVPTWKEDLDFTVQLAALDPADVTADEYVPLLGTSTATVTISAATKKATGTVQFCGFGELNEPLADVKKPAATVKSGEKAYFWLERTGGSDGKVGVTVTPTKGKAMPDVNYVDEPQTLVWESGETEAKCFVLETLVEDVELQSAKAMTLKLAADKAYADTAKLGATATLTISDGKVTGTVEEYAATFAKTDGITVKQGKADTWYFDAAGTLRSITPAAGAKAELTVTLTGPGKFAFTPTFVNTGLAANAATCTFGKEVISMAAGGEIVRYVEKGTTTVKFAVSRDKNDKAEDTACYLALASGKADGTPFVWKQLKAPTLVGPLPGAIVNPAEESEIEWTDVDTAGDKDVVYRVWFDTEKNKSKLGTGTPVQEGAETSYCTGCGMTQPGLGESWVCRVDSAFVDATGSVVLTAVNPTIWSYKTIPAGAASATVVSGTDVDGNAISSLEKVGGAYPVKLMQGVAVNIQLGADTASKVTYALASGSKLPDGLKLDANKGAIAGVPTKVGEYQTAIGVKQGSTAGGTKAFVFTVESANLAAGTFNGFVDAEDERLIEDEVTGEWAGLASAKIGSFSFTSTEAGKLTAKLTVGATSYSFTDNNGWDGKGVMDNALAGVTNVFETVVKFTMADRTTVLCTNRLVVAACAEKDEEEGFWEARDTPMDVTLTLSLQTSDKKSVVRDVVYTGTACRDNSKDAETLEALADWAGYYTFSLPCELVVDYLSGNGYMTLTIDAKGKAKLAAVLADGTTKPSASATMAYVSENDQGEREARIPLYYGKGTVSFGGWLRLKLMDDGTPVAIGDTVTSLQWIDSSKTSTYEGETGFIQRLLPTGGYYDTVKNLQTYYLDYAFRVEEIDTWDLPAELLGESEEYVCYPGLYDEYLTLLGSNITMEKQVKVMRTDDKKLVDWAQTVNPSALTMNFKRATGIYSGQFEIWGGSDYDEETGLEKKQTKLGTFNHAGVLLLSRDELGLSFSDGVMPGFWNAKVKLRTGAKTYRDFSISLPFTIVPEDKDNDWTEELPRTLKE